jgi:hypothetical protein
MIEKFAKWGALLAIISAVLVTVFQEFTPRYKEWKENYPDADDYVDDELPATAGLVNPLEDVPSNPTPGYPNPLV